ncbi:MAG: nucleoside/nucleotide kinase family protein [Anaerostipes sp.]|nr:nucleoside/nucleotide kinase family protein [Anaerostipes sp.]MDD3745578.1 nucleoside/nucleotide kinase family protein [Anaerostipes sp.]
MKEWKKYKFDVNGFEIECEYSKEAIETIFLPLLNTLSEIQRKKKNRIIVFIAAAPAVGKTTLSKFLEYLSTQIDGVTQIQAIGLDGFHYHADYIAEHTAVVNGKEVPMKDVKGCPETFDIDKLTVKLAAMKNEDVTWPVYDRNIHDVMEDAENVTGEIVLIEGNWLLLNEGKWKDLKKVCDYSIFIRGEEHVLKDRLIQRKIQGGLSRQEAVKFYETSDCLNVKRALSHSLPADLELFMTEDNDYK